MERIIDALLERHHQVTAITNFKWNGPKPVNYTEILIDPPLDFETQSTFTMEVYTDHKYEIPIRSEAKNLDRIGSDKKFERISL